MEAIPCERCQAPLLKRVSDRGVTPVDSDAEIPFRRGTDYVMCHSCMATFPVRDLIRRALPSEPSEQDADIIMLLERLAQRQR